ncbi:MAG: hypothetical protein HKN60_03440 [Rhizobiales bacterium]|nr:hypothetical protein [Hyphomicrobiales bacterium]
MPASDLPSPDSFEQAVRLVGDHDIRLVDPLEKHMQLVSFTPGHIEVALGAEAPADLANRFAATLTRATGSTWVVSVAGDGPAAPPDEATPASPPADQPDAEPELVQKVKDRFPGAKVVEVRDLPQAGGSTGSGDGGQGSSIGLVDDELGDDTSRSA